MTRPAAPLRLFLVPLLAAVLLACSSKAPAASPTASPVAIGFEYDAGIPEADHTLVERTIAEARAYYVRELGRDLQIDVTVHVTTQSAAGFLGFSFGRDAWILTGGDDWPKGSDVQSSITKQRVVAHELFHNFQSDLQYTDDALPSKSPRWLVEGSAEYAASHFIAEKYTLDWHKMLQGYARDGRGYAGRIDANGLLTYPFYAKSVVAVDAVLDGRPLKLLGDYFALTGRMDWQQAFAQVFGVDPETFVNGFESTLH
jgi:hypothetical protein